MRFLFTQKAVVKEKYSIKIFLLEKNSF